MTKIKDLYINEADYDLENGEKGRLAVFLYAGPCDPRPILDSAVRNYVGDNQYYEFIDAQLDCPWVRVVMSNIKDMPEIDFDKFILKKERKEKLKNLFDKE